MTRNGTIYVNGKPYKPFGKGSVRKQYNLEYKD